MLSYSNDQIVETSLHPQILNKLILSLYSITTLIMIFIYALLLLRILSKRCPNKHSKNRFLV